MCSQLVLEHEEGEAEELREMRTCLCDLEFNFGSGNREAIGVEFDGSARHTGLP
jgi:hypothetical protein